MKKIYALFIILSCIFAQNEYLVTLPATSYTEWVYYSFETHEVVDITNPESSLDWDIAMQRKHIRSNSGLAGIGFGGGYVDSTKTWNDNWSTMNELPSNMSWHTDETFYDFYDIVTHTMGEGIENPSLRSWGWFNNTFQLIPTNYVMFVRCANGEDIIKLWAYDYYANGSGNIAIRYQTGFNSNLSNDISENKQFSLGNAYPNPFNPSTSFEINIPEHNYLDVNVYDIRGLKVDNVYSGNINSGKHTLRWDANELQSGVYFIKSDFSGKSYSQKVLLVK
tara:strand:+ start:234 stop:1070 length:837 start_codon:yes stop_codon:yes gene_type:complete